MPENKAAMNKFNPEEESIEITFPFELDPDKIEIHMEADLKEGEKYRITIDIDGPFSSQQKELLEALMNGINEDIVQKPSPPPKRAKKGSSYVN